MMYAGLPPALAENANRARSPLDERWIRVNYLMFSLNYTVKDTFNTSNSSPREEVCDSDVAISILVCFLSFLAQISNPT